MATAFRRFTSANEREYLASGDWKCPESSTGAHHWNCNAKPPVCKVCGKVDVVDTPGHSPLPA